VQADSTLAVRQRIDSAVKGKRETNFILINPQKVEAKVYIMGKNTAHMATQTTGKGHILWTGTSTLEEGTVGCAVVWKE
jgi:hypothetical protein